MAFSYIPLAIVAASKRQKRGEVLSRKINPSDVPLESKDPGFIAGSASRLHCGKCGWSLTPEQFSVMSDGKHDLAKVGIVEVMALNKELIRCFWFVKPKKSLQKHIQKLATKEEVP